MFSKNEKKKDIGTIMIGFTVLMFGMETMSDAVKPLADVPEFASYFAEYDQGRIRDLQVGRLYLLRQSVGFPQECDATAYRDQKEQFHSSRHQPG